MTLQMTPDATLPADGLSGTLVGRVQLPAPAAGPAVVAVRKEGLFDISAEVPTVAELCADADPVARVRDAEGRYLGSLEDILAATTAGRQDRPRLLAPVDLQAVKACGVTFAVSIVERFIEERTQGDPARAREVREALAEGVGARLGAVRPGSPEAERLKETLVEHGLWSQYLEVAIGPDAEVFTKAQPLSAVGCGAEVGLHPRSRWNNPEPEVVVVVSPGGDIVGATLGNDVNLRDFEGRSALLLGKAKDNNASCAVGPFLRLLGGGFHLDDVRRCELTLEIEGEEDGYRLVSTGSMTDISRDVEELVEQAMDGSHQYPDGMVLFTGSMFAPVDDRDEPGMGFTHRPGDRVRISSPALGGLLNRVTTSDAAPPWTFGAVALMRNLAARGLL